MCGNLPWVLHPASVTSIGNRNVYSAFPCTNINHPCYSLEQAAEEAFVSDAEDVFPGTEWERVAQLCDFNPKASKQAKDVSRMRSVLISLKQAPLVR
ncbi:clathrin light chain A isoform X3 [Nothoprocta perdicaria]|uniref:clathrin light chain A isoform X3 n=1 Tax=Nothoprocta perdicaria TaxID=30464 RepID=UPI000E1C346C|nr:clathrin light chain A isoform X3 [Nothoprocta perdicaria]